MTIRILKMSLASLGLLLVASFLTTKTFRAEITIAAPLEKGVGGVDGYAKLS